jgi:hypothetical protein
VNKTVRVVRGKYKCRKVGRERKKKEREVGGSVLGRDPHNPHSLVRMGGKTDVECTGSLSAASLDEWRTPRPSQFGK